MGTGSGFGMWILPVWGQLVAPSPWTAARRAPAHKLHKRNISGRICKGKKNPKTKNKDNNKSIETLGVLLTAFNIKGWAPLSRAHQRKLEGFAPTHFHVIAIPHLCLAGSQA
jgi:hypothetical protein